MRIVNSLRTRALLGCLLAMAALLALMHFYALPKITSVTQLRPDSTEKTIFLPELHPGDAFVTHIRMDYQPGQQTNFLIIAQGCLRYLTLNDTHVPFSSNLRCKYKAGLPVDFQRQLKPGENHLIIITDRPGDLYVWPVVFDSDPADLSNWLGFALILLSCAVVVLFMRRLTGEWGTGWIMALGMLMYFFQFVQTTFIQQVMDMPGHLEYISFIAKYWYLPAPRLDDMYYHAPLYYVIEAAILRAAFWLGSFDPVSVMRLFSLVCFMTFLMFTSLTLRMFLRRSRTAYYIALLLFTLYPTGIIFAARLDSHLLLYVFYAGCIFFTLRWLEEGEDRYFGQALIMFGFALATRSNSFILLPLLGLAVLYQWCKRGGWWPPINLRSMIIIVGLLAVYYGAAVNIGRSTYYRYTDYNGVGNLHMLHPNLRVKNTLDKFTQIHMNSYKTRPFWSPWRDSSGRQYFWNSMLKTSLFGEFRWAQPQLALQMAILLLVLIGYGIVGSLFSWRDIWRRPEFWILLILLFVPIAALMRSRWLYPFSCTQDFRYIYPALMGFCGLIGMVIERHLALGLYNIRAIAGIALCIVFCIYSVAFFLLQ